MRKMEFIIVENENRALIVENELIKKLHPKYNILLKDDKSYPHLMLNLHDEYPALRKFRGIAAASAGISGRMPVQRR